MSEFDREDRAQESQGAEMDPRRRKLDELFADEPWLSPTMKARRLHEKLAELQARDEVRARGLPSAAYVGGLPPGVVRQEPVRPQANGPWNSLHEARAALRATHAAHEAPVSAHVEALRDSLLKLWMEEPLC